MGVIYDGFKQRMKTVHANVFNAFMDRTGLVTFELDGTCYEVFLTRKRANRYSIIHCKDNTVLWQQVPVLPRIAGTMHGKSEPLLRLTPSKTCVRIVVVRGKPHSITGLDEGVFRSANCYHKDFINVMSETRFKML